jgi:hypothetical protein
MLLLLVLFIFFMRQLQVGGGKAATDRADWSWDDFVEKNSTEWDEDGGE